MIVLGGTLPPTHFDVREYHLQVPKEWFQAGRVTFLPHNVYGNMPLGAEMHALLGTVLWPGSDAEWWGSLIGKTVIASISIITALGIYAAGRRFFTPSVGAVGAFVYLSTPWTAFVSMNGLIDGVSAFYNLMTVYAVALFLGYGRYPQESDNQNSVVPGGKTWPLVAVAGFLAGAGVACKYPALLFLVAPVFVLVAWRPWTKVDWRAAVIFGLFVFAGCGLWLAKNWVMAGNPTYPLLYDWLGGESWNAEQNARWERAHGPPHGGGWEAYKPSELWNSLKLLTVSSDFLSPAVVPLAVVGWFAARYRKSLALLAALIVWTLAVWWLMTHRVDRFLIPLLPLVSLFCGVGAAWRGRSAWWLVSMALLVWSGLASFATNSTILVNDYRYLVSLTELRKDIPHPADPDMSRIHPAHRYLNEHVRPGYRALLVGEAQVFDLDVPILYNTCFDDCTFETLFRDRSLEERLQVLKEQRISHLFFYWRELDRYRSPGNYGYSEFVTRELVRNELAGSQGLLRRVPLEVPPDNGEVYEVLGWEDW